MNYIAHSFQGIACALAIICDLIAIGGTGYNLIVGFDMDCVAPIGYTILLSIYCLYDLSKNVSLFRGAATPCFGKSAVTLFSRIGLILAGLGCLSLTSGECPQDNRELFFMLFLFTFVWFIVGSLCLCFIGYTDDEDPTKRKYLYTKYGKLGFDRLL
mmetsp:Transcript_20967/g.23716  ORF Transcript_20967/g.23716 Transcript_20967/m.23716 type:complete len:157 (-) Transcript_20967:1228-1698(-)